MSDNRWESNEAFVAACAALDRIDGNFTVEHANALQDWLLREGYSIQRSPLSSAIEVATNMKGEMQRLADTPGNEPIRCSRMHFQEWAVQLDLVCRHLKGEGEREQTVGSKEERQVRLIKSYVETGDFEEDS